MARRSPDRRRRFKPEIEEQILGSAVLVPIVTPSYFHSEWCEAERKVPRAGAADRGLDVGNKARIVKAAKTRVPLSEYPQELRELLEFRFFVAEPNGTAREFHLSSSADVRLSFNTVVDDLAQAIEKITVAGTSARLDAAAGKREAAVQPDRSTAVTASRRSGRFRWACRRRSYRCCAAR